jgi:endonuclease/exonuclease/phosphatase family metal-dependent hydrolase
MKIATWNLWPKNRQQKEGVDFLLSLNADIICLQELREETVKYLHTIKGYFCVPEIDLHIGNEVFWKAILSKQKSSAVQTVPFIIKTKPCLALTQLPKIKICTEGRNFQYADFELEGKKIRVFNVHLSSTTGSLHRFKQLNEIQQYFIKNGTIICGDFNSFATPILNALVGLVYRYSFKEYFIREYDLLTHFAREHHLQVGYDKQVTHPLSRTHLDHILVPEMWSVKDAAIYKNRYGSDHRLMTVEVLNEVNC